MLSCKDATHLMSEAQDTPLPLTSRLQLEVHLIGCKGCRDFNKQMRFIREACRSYTKERDEQGK